MPSVDDDDWFADLLDSSTLNSKFVTKALLERSPPASLDGLRVLDSTQI